MSLNVSKGAVHTALDKASHISPTNVSNKPVHVLKRMVLAHVTDSFALVIATEAALSETDSEVVDTVHY